MPHQRDGPAPRATATGPGQKHNVRARLLPRLKTSRKYRARAFPLHIAEFDAARNAPGAQNPRAERGLRVRLLKTSSGSGSATGSCSRVTQSATSVPVGLVVVTAVRNVS